MPANTQRWVEERRGLRCAEWVARRLGHALVDVVPALRELGHEATAENPRRAVKHADSITFPMASLRIDGTGVVVTGVRGRELDGDFELSVQLNPEGGGPSQDLGPVTILPEDGVATFGGSVHEIDVVNPGSGEIDPEIGVRLWESILSEVRIVVDLSED